MNIKFFNAALGIALTATTLSANAQKTLKEGIITVSTSMNGQQAQPKIWFTADSTALGFSTGPATIKMIADTKMTYFAVLVDVPVAQKKFAGVATPADIEEMESSMPKFTFAPTSETKTIGKFSCKKVVAKDTKTSKTYDVWITNDVSIPDGVVAKYYAGIGGFPIQYTSFAQGQEVPVTVTDIIDQKVPAGTFSSAGYDKMSLQDLKSMGGGGGH